MPLEPTVDLHHLAEVTSGLAGGDIESLCTTAAMNALGRESQTVCDHDFEEALGKA